MISFYKKAIFSVSFLALFAQINASEQQDQNSETAPVTFPADSNNNDENAPATESVAEPKKAEKNTNVVSEKEKENSKSEADQSQQQTQPAPNNETAQQQESPSGSDNAQNKTATDSVPKEAAQTTTNESSAPQEIVAIETPDEQPVSVTIDVDAPSYDHLVPVPEWNRYSGDSAGSLKEWVRWWKYLRMKTPIVMKWIDDFVVRIYPDNEIFRAIFVKGIYDPNSMVVISSLLPKDGVFIDVGASFGYFSIIATKAVGPNGRVIAIEPSSRDYNRLIDNVRINNLGNIISTYRLAISDATGTALLSIATEERSALNTLGNEFSFKGVDKVAKENVDTIALDDFVVANQIKHVDVLKLDIEGSELKALHGAKKTIAKFRPAIMLGVNSNALKASGTDHDEIQKTLSELGYKAYRIVDNGKILGLESIPDLTKEPAKIIFCLHENVLPPVLPQPEKKSFFQHLTDFFTR